MTGELQRNERVRPARRNAVIVAIFCFALGSANSASASTGEESPYDVVRRLGEVLVLIEREYVVPVDRKQLLEGSIRGMVSDLDPHSEYLQARDYDMFQDDTKGQFGGIGVEVDLRRNQITIISPIEGSPAERAGLLPGDRIVAIDGQNIAGKRADELIRLMRGEPGSVVAITIERDGVEKPTVFKLTREVIDVASVSGKMLAGDIAYLRVKQFQRGTQTELLDQIGKLRDESPNFRGIILDLRNNPGGLVNEARGVADEFLPGGVVYTTRHRGVVVDEVRASSGGSVQQAPLVVLVNGYSASAAELVAGALKDHGRATIVGSQTFGKGSVQSIIDLSGGNGLRLTTMRYYTPSGHAVQARGITPNVIVEDQAAADATGGLIREGELPDALEAEGPNGTKALPSAAATTPTPDPAKASNPDAVLPPPLAATRLGVARVVPTNPKGGPDTALAVAYELLLGKTAKP